MIITTDNDMKPGMVTTLERPAREDFEQMYGKPADVDLVWVSRNILQDCRQQKRDHLRELEDAAMFGPPGGLIYDDIKTKVFNSMGIPRDKL